MAFSRPRSAVLPCAWRSFALLLGAAASTTGCYTYRSVAVADLEPLQQASLPVGTVAQPVNGDRGELHPDGHLRFEVGGTVASAGGDSVVVSVPSNTPTDPSMRAMTFRQPVTLRRSDVERIELRTLDRRKTTWAAVTIGALSVTAAVFAIRRGGEATGSTPVPGGPNEARVPALLLWSFR